MSRQDDAHTPLAALYGIDGPLFGLDLGEKTLGVAIGAVATGVATPLTTLKRGKFAATAAQLGALIEERGAQGLVMGLPVTMAGEVGPRAQASKAFARNLERTLALPVALWDERLSTAAVERDLIAADMRRDARAKVIDAHAAAFILQGALDRLRALGPGRPRG